MGENNFSKSKCTKSLLRLGFKVAKVRKGKHVKYKAPPPYNKPNQYGQRPFIMIPKQRKFYLQDEVINELKRMGGDELVKKFRDNL